MKKIIKILISITASLMALVSFATVAFAQSAAPLSVIFSANPLFNEANFLPGNEVERTIDVSNNSGGAQNIIVEAINVVDNGDLGEKLNLVIKEGDAVLYKNSLGTFLRSGEVPLSALSTNGKTTYSFNVAFDSSADNNLQNKIIGFDLCVGFSGGTKNCGETVIDDENNTDGNSIQGTGGGSSGGSHKLIIFNENSVISSATAVITWETSILSTSQVIYGLASEPHDLVLVPPNFGYPSYTAEDPVKVTSHSVILTGLVPGQTYVYRVVSRASPPTVSPEHEFTVPIVSGPLVISEMEESALGENSENIGYAPAPAGEVAGASDENNLAAVFSAGFNRASSWWWLWIIILLLIAYTVWRLVLKPRK